MKDKELKPNANAVGAFIGRPHIEENAPYKKEHQNKPNANAVGVAPLGDPHFEEITPASSKACSNQNSKHQTLTSNVAITLIALVITIIVMLILVGVTVSVAINGGLFSTAKKAVTKTEEAKDSELRFMAMANAATHDKLWTYTSKDGKTIPIPAGFAPTEIEGETSTEEGLVIIDAEGNEFVWIPCTEQEYNDANWDNNWLSYEYTNKTWPNETQTSIGATSIKDNGGFYVARYETGIPENALFYASKEGDSYQLWNTNSKGKNTTKNGTVEYKPVSKKGYPAWNCISQTNAEQVSKAMYANNPTVDSYLIDSHAWNYICEDILKEKNNITNCSDWGNYVDNKTTKYENLDVLYAIHEFCYEPWGWKQYAEGEGLSGRGAKYHKGSISADTIEKRTGTGTSKVIELATGASEDFMGYNIYDMAGNMWEWTTETSNDSAAIRGGCFRYDGSSYPVVVAMGTNGDNSGSVIIGFRVVLYL